jgi:hypothetical protein
MSLFNGAQSFYLSPTIVANSTTVDLTSVGMHFMYRPQALNNKSGIAFPGITMFLTDVVNGLPNMSNTSIFSNLARAEWNSILTSSDGSIETVFTFVSPVTLQTGKSYAFCWTYDGGEDFLPWTNVKGNRLVGTTNPSSGPSSIHGGSYFTFASLTALSTSQAVLTPASAYQDDWTAVVDTDVKFSIYAARYAINSVPIVANLASLPIDTVVYSSNLFLSYSGNSIVNIIKPAPRVENIVFDIEKSTKQSYVGSQRVYQDTPQWPGGNVYLSVVTTGSNSVTANATLSNGAAFQWSQIFGSYAGEKYVVIDHGTTVDVRKVTGIISNTVIAIDEATTVANSAARIKISPVAVTDSFNTSFLDGSKASLMFMRDSNANSTVRFVGYPVDHSLSTVTANGTGYSNSDVLYVVGYNDVNNAIKDNYKAIANLSTNSTGGVLAVNWSNVGSGFVNSAQVVIRVLSGANSTVNTATTNTSAGSALTMNLVFGSTLKTEQTNNIFRNARPVNIDVHSAFTAMNLVNVSNTSHYPAITTQYYMANNSLTPNGYSTHVLANVQNYPMTLNTRLFLNTLTNIPVIVSRSNEFGTLYPDGSPNDKASSLNPYSNTFTMQITTTSNNDWVALGPFHSPLIEFTRYMINNDHTNEHTDQGNALARHITTVFNMTGPANTNYKAEDLRFWVSAWRPAATDIQVYARLYHSTDNQPFTAADWTRLELIEGSNNFSTQSYVDLSYGIPSQPNTTSILVGSVSTTNNSATITGANTNWQADIANNTLVKIYDPLFANSNFSVMLVTGVTSNTSATVDQVFCTNTVLGVGGFELTGRSGLKMDVLGYGHQAFNNIQFDNVARYYNQSQHVYDGFDSVQIKCVMLSSDPHYIPRIHNLRGLGVSA